MFITKITRTYSRSINTRTYNLPESWIKIESTLEAQIESQDNPVEVSKMLAAEAQKNVLEQITEIEGKMRAAAERNRATAAGNVPGAPTTPANAVRPL